MTCAVLLILLQLCLWSSQVWSTTDLSKDGSRCHEQPALSEPALWINYGLECASERWQQTAHYSQLCHEGLN